MLFIVINQSSNARNAVRFTNDETIMIIILSLVPSEGLPGKEDVNHHDLDLMRKTTLSRNMMDWTILNPR